MDSPEKLKRIMEIIHHGTSFENFDLAFNHDITIPEDLLTFAIRNPDRSISEAFAGRPDIIGKDRDDSTFHLAWSRLPQNKRTKFVAENAARMPNSIFLYLAKFDDADIANIIARSIDINNKDRVNAIINESNNGTVGISYCLTVLFQKLPPEELTPERITKLLNPEDYSNGGMERLNATMKLVSTRFDIDLRPYYHMLFTLEDRDIYMHAIVDYRKDEIFDEDLLNIFKIARQGLYPTNTYIGERGLADLDAFIAKTEAGFIRTKMTEKHGEFINQQRNRNSV